MIQTYMKHINDLTALIYKPSGPTSFDIIYKLRKITGIKKIGHSGTLDPLAEGLLIVFIGKARKKQAEFQGLDKEYLAEAVFGTETDTYDRKGKIMKQLPISKIQISKQEVANTLRGFVGQITQTAPPFSAIKVKGQRLYKKARKGQIDFDKLPKRKITIYETELLKFEKAALKTPPKAQIRIYCSKGTYIRSLIHDLGQKLGCGAYVSALKRTKIGDYLVENALTVEEFQQKWRTQVPTFSEVLETSRLRLEE